MNKNKDVPFSHYLLVFVIIVVSVFITIYSMKLYKSIKSNKLDTSPLSEKVNEVFINELSETIGETNDLILYIGYNGDETVRSMEKKLLGVIEKSKINDYFIYVNVTDYLENKEYINTLKEEYPGIKNDIVVAPMLIYLKNGIALEAYSSELKVIDENVLKKLIDKYDIGN